MIVLSEFFEIIKSASFWTDIIKSLLIALITAITAMIFTKKYLKKILFVKKINKYGFDSFVSTNNISEREYKHIFHNAKEIKIIFVTGINFFRNVGHQEMIKDALKRGTKIKILLAKKNNIFLDDIYNMEYNYGNRSINQILDLEVDEVHEIFEKIKMECNEYSKNLEVKYYSTEYRLPLVVAEFEKKNKRIINAWVNITLLPVKATKHILLKLEYDENDYEQESDNYINIIESHFDEIWKHSSNW